MIIKHGIDIVEVSRIQKAILKSDSFLKKVFTQKEIEYCETKKQRRYQSYAARFAAKEALLKALGTGWSQGIAWTDIETLNDKFGKPDLFLYGKAKEIFESYGLGNISVSLSHTKEIAVGSVVLTYNEDTADR